MHIRDIASEAKVIEELLAHHQVALALNTTQPGGTGTLLIIWCEGWNNLLLLAAGQADLRGAA